MDVRLRKMKEGNDLLVSFLCCGCALSVQICVKSVSFSFSVLVTCEGRGAFVSVKQSSALHILLLQLYSEIACIEIYYWYTEMC